MARISKKCIIEEYLLTWGFVNKVKILIRKGNSVIEKTFMAISVFPLVPPPGKAGEPSHALTMKQKHRSPGLPLGLKPGHHPFHLILWAKACHMASWESRMGQVTPAMLGGHCKLPDKGLNSRDEWRNGVILTIHTAPCSSLLAITFLCEGNVNGLYRKVLQKGCLASGIYLMNEWKKMLDIIFSAFAAWYKSL